MDSTTVWRFLLIQKKKKKKKKKMFVDKSEKLFLSIKVCKILLYTSGAQDVCDKAIVTIFIRL